MKRRTLKLGDAFLRAVLAVILLFSVIHAYRLLSGTASYDSVEGIVLHHQKQLAQTGELYPRDGHDAPPYSIPLYGPMYYGLTAIGQSESSGYFSGRLLSTVSIVALMALAYGILVFLGVRGIWVAWGMIAWLILIGPFKFGFLNRCDAFAIALGGSAVLSGLQALNRRSFPGFAALLVIAAAWNKPTAAVAPFLVLAVAPCLLGIPDCFRRGAKWVGLVVIGGMASALWIEMATDRSLFANYVLGNANAFAWSQVIDILVPALGQPTYVMGLFAATYLVLCKNDTNATNGKVVGVYALISAGVAALTLGKLGSNQNYFIESAWSGGLCLAICFQRIQDGQFSQSSLRAIAATLATLSLLAGLPVMEAAEQKRKANGIEADLFHHWTRKGEVLTLDVGHEALQGRTPFVVDLHIVTRLSEAGRLDLGPLRERLLQGQPVAVIADWSLRDRRCRIWPPEIIGAMDSAYRPLPGSGRLTVYVPRRRGR